MQRLYYGATVSPLGLFSQAVDFRPDLRTSASTGRLDVRFQLFRLGGSGNNAR
jgi:hypothetical protein